MCKLIGLLLSNYFIYFKVFRKGFFLFVYKMLNKKLNIVYYLYDENKEKVILFR